jgi:hypothetical protein
VADTAIRTGPTTYANTTDNTFYTSTSVTTHVLSLSVCNTTATDAWFSIGLNATALTAANGWRFQLNVPAYGSWDWSGFLVLASGDTIHLAQQTASALNLTMSGITY